MVVFAIDQSTVLTMHPLIRFIRSHLATRFMPCYVGQLSNFFATAPISLSNTIHRGCHGKIPLNANFLCVILCCLVSAVLPQFSRAAQPPAGPPVAQTPEQESEQSIDKPDFSVHVTRPNAPKSKKDVPYSADQGELDSDSNIDHLKGNVVFEFPDATLKADAVDYDENTNIATATGHVYYRDYDHDEVMYADSAVYNADTESGEYHHVRGYMKAKIVARPGVLVSKDPFYFEAAWVEKMPDRYVLHEAFITDCEMPNPWWTLHSSRIDYYPHDHALAHNAVYRFEGVPVFFFPWFRKSLKTEPRQSGFLTPNIGHSSTRGYMVGLGYYQTIGRSMDATYILQDFTSRGYAHHVDFRGKPTDKSYFNFIFYGVQDRGILQNGALLKAPGYSITGTGKIEFGNGWVARGAIDYLSSYLFHQQFTDSYSQAIFSETHTSAYVEKHFGDYTFDVSASRTENFIDTTPGNFVIIRTLPQFELNNSFQQISSGPIPLWFSLHSTYGLFHRVEPLPTGEPVVDYYVTSQFTSRADLEPSLASVIRIGGFTLLPEITQHETFYSQSLVNYVVSSNTLLRSAPEAKVDLIFPSLARVFNRKTMFGDKLRHVIEPRVRYDYVTGVNDFNKTLLFDPTDLLTDTREVQFSLANRIYAKRGDSVSEIFSWDLSEKYYFDPTFGGALVPGQRNLMLTELNLTGYTFLDGIRRRISHSFNGTGFAHQRIQFQMAGRLRPCHQTDRQQFAIR